MDDKTDVQPAQGAAPPGSHERGWSVPRPSELEVLAASCRLRERSAIAGRRAKALRERAVAVIADVAVVEEKIARIHETLAAESPDGAAAHLSIAADARQAARRAGTICAQLTGGGMPAATEAADRG